jgi:hypothetical protein
MWENGEKVVVLTPLLGGDFRAVVIHTAEAAGSILASPTLETVQLAGTPVPMRTIAQQS